VIRRLLGYLLGALLVLPMLFIIPSCKTADEGAEKLTGVAERMKQGSAGEALEELEAEEGGGDDSDEESEDLEDIEAELE
jgi:hypothetical protein